MTRLCNWRSLNDKMRRHLIICSVMFLSHAARSGSLLPISSAASDACPSAITVAERQFQLPAKLLGTIALIESGRLDRATGRAEPWPWSINVGGTSHFYASKAEAVAAVKELQAGGARSIDIGCMQINLLYHPNAFASLDEAFNPLVNASYGAQFLTELHREIGNWGQAAAAYHSRTGSIGQAYEDRVLALWPLSMKFSEPAREADQGVAGGERDFTIYTPAFAAALKQMLSERARLAMQHRIMPPPTGLRQAIDLKNGDDPVYTREFNATLKQLQADSARLIVEHALIMPPRETPALRRDTGSSSSGAMR